MKNWNAALHAAVGLVISSAAMSEPNTPIETPQQAAAAFATVEATDRDASWATQVMSAFAGIYAKSIRETADPSNSAPLSGTISVACPEGGTLVVTGQVGLLYSLTADYQACKAYDGFEYVRNGRVTAKFVRSLISATSYKLVDVEFGDAAGGFVETRQFLPPQSAELDPTRSTLKYRITGDLHYGDYSEQPTTDSFYLLNGTFHEESSAYSGTDPIVMHFLLDSQNMVVKNNFEDRDGAELAIDQTHFVSGKLSHTTTVDMWPVPSDGSFYWSFDNFKSTRAYRRLTGEYLRTYNGELEVKFPAEYVSAEGCRNGTFRVHTPHAIEETSNGSRDFTDGFVLLNGSGKIRFNDTEPRIKIKAQGETVETDGYEGLIATGNCYL